MEQNFKATLEAEVKAAADALVESGNINGVELKAGDYETNLEWKVTLDNAFAIIAAFADKHGIDIE